MIDQILLTCEHSSNRIPARYAALFRSAGHVLRGHRAQDIGAGTAARFLASRLQVPLISGSVSRLLVDLNRSIGHPGLFSEYVAGLGSDEKERILARYYHPYRRRVEAALRACLDQGSVLHVSVHSFTPVLDGEIRRADVGLLYDPARAVELDVSARLRLRLLQDAPGLGVRRNYPYRGTADGLTTRLRRSLASGRYAGIEIELNQGMLTDPRQRLPILRAVARAVGQERVLQPAD